MVVIVVPNKKMSFRNSRRLPLTKQSTPPEVKRIKKEQKRDVNRKIAMELIKNHDPSRARADRTVTKEIFDKYVRYFGADMVDKNMVFRFKREMLEGHGHEAKNETENTATASIEFDSVTTISSLSGGSPATTMTLATSEGAQSVSLSDGAKKPGGRPKGTTKAAKRDYNTREEEATEKAVIQYFEARAAAGSNDRVAPGTIKTIIDRIEKEYNLPQGTVREETIRSRFKRRNTTGKGKTHVSPIAPIEPIIVDFCVKLARMGSPLDRDQVISLTNDLLKNTNELERLKSYKQRHTSSNAVESVGKKWYDNFMQRHDHIIKRVASRNSDVKRKQYITRENFKMMYDCVYERMVDAGVAQKFESEVLYDANGEITINQDDAVGFRLIICLLTPTMCTLLTKLVIIPIRKRKLELVAKQ